VYASYADRCATERVQPLNPASFGKLVRIIFKGIQTRRLGVRGESKYHYVDLALKSDNPENNENTFGRGIFGHEPRSPQSMQLDFSAVPQLTANATFNADGSPIASPILAPRGYAGQGDGAVFAEPYNVTEFRSKFPYSQTYAQRLCFPNIEDEITTTDVQLPNVWPYAPEGADEDAADALQALYRSHCTSLIEYFKKCKEKQFWRMFTTFQGTLTVPVQKLLTAPSMAAWVRECDYYMYQRMLAFLAPIALQVLPPAALIFFDSISHGLHAHIIKTFSGLPLHVLEARLEPATRFCELINRMIKVNNAAHAASQVLEYNEHREQLHQEWRRYINPKRIMEGELPGCGYEQTFKILTDEMAALLRPLTPPPVYEDGLPYANPNAQTDGADNYIDRIDTLLRSLPTRFPQAPARTIVDCVKNLGTAAMREFTMQGANSFHAWWIVKVFIDEYSQWLVTSGGFMAHRPGRRAQSSPDAGGSLTNGAVESSVEDSRHSSVALIDKDEMSQYSTIRLRNDL
jgi:regulatory factor X